MPHCGMTLASVRNSFFAEEAGGMARNYRTPAQVAAGKRSRKRLGTLLAGVTWEVALSFEDIP
jgi:hypothetical protein